MADVKSKCLADGEIFETADRLHSAAIHLLRRLRVRDRESGVGPAQLSALSVLVLGGGPRSLGELAEAEQVRPPTMSRIVAGLVRTGLVRRGKTEDGRRVRLAATRKGTRVLQEGRRRRVRSLAEALSSLSSEDRGKVRRLIKHLEKVIRNL
jgi:DNA-binding MarR family transcriptional regulator